MKSLKYISLAFLQILSIFSLPAHADFFERRFNPEVDRIDVAEGRERIEAFRNFRYQGDYSFQFELVHMPRRGGRDVYTGTLWGGWNAQGPITRVELQPQCGGQQVIRLLIQNGPVARIWVLGEKGVQELAQKDWLNPLFDNVVYTAFDLSLSFLFWENFAYQGPNRVKGRPAQIFIMSPPPEFAKCHPCLGSVYMAMDNCYNVLLQAEVRNLEGFPTKSIKLNNFQKVGEEYIIKQMDVIDEVTHDKTRLEVTAAAMNLSIDYSYFTSNSLSNENPKITKDNYYPVR